MKTILDWLTPWYVKLGIVIAILAGISYGVHMYNESIREQVRIDTRAAVEAEYEPKFTALATQFKNLETNIIETRLASKAAADLAIAKEKERADFATSRYKDQVALVKRWQDDRNATLSVFDDLPDSMWNTADIISANASDGAGHLRISGYVSRLGKRYKSCERDLTTALETAGRAVDRAAERGAAVEALTRP